MGGILHYLLMPILLARAILLLLKVCREFSNYKNNVILCTYVYPVAKLPSPVLVRYFVRKLLHSHVIDTEYVSDVHIR